MANTYDSFGKMELRAQCKAAKIKGYGNMTVQAMREALTVRDTVAVKLDVVNLAGLGVKGLGGKCPHCKAELGDAVTVHEDLADEFGVTEALALQKLNFACNACDGEWGEPAVYDTEIVEVVKPVKEVKPKREKIARTSEGKGIAIQRDRETRNGITRPSVGGKCAAVWDHCDHLASTEVKPMPALLKAWAVENGFNPNNAVIEMYQWRKFTA